MRLGTRGIIVSFFVLSQCFLFSQTDSMITLSPINEVEAYLSPEDYNLEETEYLDKIESLLENPIDLNSISRDELCELPFFDINSANRIIEYRTTNNRYFSVAELRMVPGLDQVFVERVRGFFKIKSYEERPESDKSKIRPNTSAMKNFHLRTRTMVRPNLAGDEKSYEYGSKTYSRISVKQSNFQISGLTERDFAETNYTDFFSGGIAFSNIFSGMELIIGDFIVNHAKSIVLSSPFPKRKSTILPSISSPPYKPRLYTSSSEYKFLRGVSIYVPINLMISNFSLTSLSIWGSMNFFDATSDSLDNATGINLSGSHTDSTSRKRKHNLRESLYGTSIDFRLYEKIRVSLLSMFMSYNKPIRLKENQVISKSEIIMSNSVAYEMRFDNFILSGEQAFSFPKNYGIERSAFSYLHSFSLSPAKGISIFTSIRNYDQEFYSLHSAPFSESSSFPYSEFGIFSAISVSTEYGKFSLFFDQFRLKGDLNGYEASLEYSVKILPKLYCVVRGKYKSKEGIESSTDHEIIAVNKKLSFRTEISYQVSRKFRIRTRGDFSLYVPTDEVSPGISKGYLLMEDFDYAVLNNFSLNARLIVFRTNDFNTAIYEFENDLPGLMTIKPLHGEGLRFYLLGKYRLFENLMIALKYSDTLLSPNEQSTILTSASPEFNLQIDFRL